MTTAVKAGKVYGLRKMSNIDNIKNYTVIDLEMTGLSAKNDKIIEIGAARVRGGEIVDTISTLVNPKQHIPQRVQELTGITDSDVENAADIFWLFSAYHMHSARGFSCDLPPIALKSCNQRSHSARV